MTHFNDSGRGRSSESGFSLHTLFGPDGLLGPNGPLGPSGPLGPGGLFADPEGRRDTPRRGERRPGHSRRPGRARRGDIRAAIVFLLAEEPLNGYGIIQQLEERTDGLWKPSPGGVYPALSQLEDEGLIEQFHEGNRRMFRLTTAGEGYVADRDAEPRPWDVLAAAAAEEAPPAAHGFQGAWESSWQDAPADTLALWKAVAGVASAVHAVSGENDDRMSAEAARILARTKSSLYKLLAETNDYADE